MISRSSGLTAALVVLALTAATSSARAQVRLAEPTCPALPFRPAEVERLLTLELSVDGVSLSPDAALVVAYGPAPCEAGVTDYEVHLMSPFAPPRVTAVDVANVPLGAVPRALALEIAELLRGRTSEPTEEERADAEALAPPSAASDPTEEAAAPDELPAPPTETETSETPAVDPVVAEDTTPEPDATPSGPPIELGFLSGPRNTPDTGAVLTTARLFLNLPLGHDLPLAVRLDAGVGFGPAAQDLVLGWVEGGFAFTLSAMALEGLDIQFGPRVWLAHGFLVDDGPNAPARVSSDVQVGVGILAGVDVALGDQLRLVLQGEVGSNLHGLELDTSAGRSGFLGAYWAAEVGLALAL